MMICKQRILVGLLASLVITQPITAMPINRFQSTYRTIRTDISRLLSNKKMDAEQKKRVMIELAVGMAIVIITGTTMWFLWIRPLQKKLRNAPIDEELKFENSSTIKASDPIGRVVRDGDETTILRRIGTAGVDFTQQDEHGNTLLHYTANRPFKSVVEELTKKGCNVNIQNNQNETPLHFAALSGQVEIVEYLLAKGADPTIQNNNGETPHHVAKEGSPIQAVLQQAGQDWLRSHPR